MSLWWSSPNKPAELVADLQAETGMSAETAAKTFEFFAERLGRFATDLIEHYTAVPHHPLVQKMGVNTAVYIRACKSDFRHAAKIAAKSSAPTPQDDGGGE